MAAVAAFVLPPVLPVGHTHSLGWQARRSRQGRRDSPRLTVYHGGELRGMLSPCGCAEGMLGGLARRGAYVRRAPTQDALVVENGDLVSGGGRQDELKAEAIADSLNAMGCAAVCLGESDLRLGVPFLSSLRARLHGAVLCANATTSDGLAPFGEVYSVSRRVAGKTVRIGITGLLSPKLADRSAARDLHVADAGPTLSRLAPRIRASGDVRVVLYHGPSAEARALVRRYPLFRLVVCAHEGDGPAAPIRESGAVFVSSGEQGKRLGRVTLSAPSWAVDAAGSVPLTAGIPDDPTVSAIRSAYLERVSAEGLLARVPRLPTETGDAYAGSPACARCHASVHAKWSGTKHATALNSLAGVKEDRDPECVPCHVIGLDRIGGFESAATTPDRANVGCEACHGPSGRHAAGSGPPPARPGARACTPCHTLERSPRFQFEAYWPKVRH